MFGRGDRGKGSNSSKGGQAGGDKKAGVLSGGFGGNANKPAVPGEQSVTIARDSFPHSSSSSNSNRVAHRSYNL